MVHRSEGSSSIYDTRVHVSSLNTEAYCSVIQLLPQGPEGTSPVNEA